jgi:hypothetical protein
MKIKNAPSHMHWTLMQMQIMGLSGLLLVNALSEMKSGRVGKREWILFYVRYFLIARCKSACYIELLPTQKTGYIKMNETTTQYEKNENALREVAKAARFPGRAGRGLARAFTNLLVEHERRAEITAAHNAYIDARIAAYRAERVLAAIEPRIAIAAKVLSDISIEQDARRTAEIETEMEGVE